ncbi:MAG: hypothetical protein ACI9FJ_002491 [Alteromonadaceae bacterium]
MIASAVCSNTTFFKCNKGRCSANIMIVLIEILYWVKIKISQLTVCLWLIAHFGV